MQVSVPYTGAVRGWAPRSGFFSDLRSRALSGAGVGRKRH
jgi:hypothetical protein